MSWTRTLAWAVMCVFALAIGVYALAFFWVPDMGGDDLRAHFATIPVSARLHVIPGGLALILGAAQFHSGLRKRFSTWHRNSGRAYVVFVLIGGIAGFVLAVKSLNPPAVQLGFATLAVIWIYSVIMAYLAARRQDFKVHEQWMIRSYALTLAAVTLRLQLGIYQGGFGFSFEESYAIVAWFSWVPNLIIAEWFFIQPRKQASAS